MVLTSSEKLCNVWISVTSLMGPLHLVSQTHEENPLTNLRPRGRSRHYSVLMKVCQWQNNLPGGPGGPVRPGKIKANILKDLENFLCVENNHSP